MNSFLGSLAFSLMVICQFLAVVAARSAIASPAGWESDSPLTARLGTEGNMLSSPTVPEPSVQFQSAPFCSVTVR